MATPRRANRENKFAKANESLNSNTMTPKEVVMEEVTKDVPVEEEHEAVKTEPAEEPTTVEVPVTVEEEKIVEVTEASEKPKKKAEPKKTEPKKAEEYDLMKELAANKKDRGIAKTTYYTSENYNKLLEIEKKTGASFSTVVNKILKSVLENM